MIPSLVFINDFKKKEEHKKIRNQFFDTKSISYF